jgi:DNA-binding MarR family transcriptional regulator
MCKHYMQSNLIQLHLLLPRRYTSLMSPQQADPGLAEAGAVGAGAGLSGALKAGADQAGARLADAVRAGADQAGARLAGAVKAGAGEPGGAPLVSAWRSLAARHASVSAALEHELGERHALGVSEFEVLERLAENEQHKFRVQELAESVHLSQSTLSRLIGRLEQHGLVQRNMCDVDRRGIDVCLTEAGRQRHAEALPTHRAVLAATMPPGTES